MVMQIHIYVKCVLSRLLLQCFFLSDIFAVSYFLILCFHYLCSHVIGCSDAVLILQCAGLVPLPALSVQSVGQKLQIGFLLLLDFVLRLLGMMVHKRGSFILVNLLFSMIFFN